MDGDGFTFEACPAGINGNGDCDDTDGTVNPGVIEATAQGNCLDGKDNDCDGLADALDPDCP